MPQKALTAVDEKTRSPCNLACKSFAGLQKSGVVAHGEVKKKKTCASAPESRASSLAGAQTLSTCMT